MIGLKTARTVVVDNDPNEGMAIVAALSKYGTGISYFKGDIDGLPEKRLTGIRLLVLDMNLLDTDPGEARAAIGPLITFLDRLLEINSRPFAIIAWTNHPLYVKEFTSMFEEARPDLSPYFLANIKKSDVRDAENPQEFDFKEIGRRFEREMESWFPYDLLMEWEQRVHDATSETTSIITEIADESSNGWSSETSKILSALAIESGGKHIGQKEKVIECLFSSLNPIHEDCLESLPLDYTRLSIASDKLQEAVDEENKSWKDHKCSRLSNSQCSKLNRMISIAHVKDGERAPRPGNIYFKLGWKTPRFPISIDNIQHSLLAKELLNFPDSLTKSQKEYIIYKCDPVLVEITPPCDYVQDKTSHCRLIAGLLVPGKYRKHIKTGSFIRDIGPIHIIKSEVCPVNGDHNLVLNSHYVTGINEDVMVKNREAYRIRKQLLTDILSWFAGQAARPGCISVRHKS